MKFKAKFLSAQTPIMMLSGTTFTTGLQPENQEKMVTLRMQSLLPVNLGRIPGNNNRAPQLVCRIYANKQTLTAAFFPESDMASACRMVDALTQYFWKYRIRDTANENGRFNFSRAQAELDLKKEPGLVDKMGDLEVAWAADGAIPSLADLAEQKRIAAIPTVKTALRKKVDIVLPEIQRALGGILDEQRQGFLTLRAEILGDRRSLDVELDAAGAQLKGLDARIERLEAAFKQMVTIMGNINENIK